MSISISKRREPGRNGKTYTLIKTNGAEHQVDQSLGDIIGGQRAYTVDKAMLDFADGHTPREHYKRNSFGALKQIIEGRFKGSDRAFIEVMERFGTYDPVNATRYILANGLFDVNGDGHVMRNAAVATLNAALDNLPKGTEERSGAIQYLFQLGKALLDKNDDVNAALILRKALIAHAQDTNDKGALQVDGTVVVATKDYIFTQFQDVVGTLGNRQRTPIVADRQLIIHPSPFSAIRSLEDAAVLQTNGYLLSDADSLLAIDPKSIGKDHFVAKQRGALATHLNARLQSQRPPLREYLLARMKPAPAQAAA